MYGGLLGQHLRVEPVALIELVQGLGQPVIERVEGS